MDLERPTAAEGPLSCSSAGQRASVHDTGSEEVSEPTLGYADTPGNGWNSRRSRRRCRQTPSSHPGPCHQRHDPQQRGSLEVNRRTSRSPPPSTSTGSTTDASTASSGCYHPPSMRPTTTASTPRLPLRPDLGRRGVASHAGEREGGRRGAGVREGELGRAAPYGSMPTRSRYEVRPAAQTLWLYSTAEQPRSESLARVQTGQPDQASTTPSSSRPDDIAAGAAS